MSDDRSHESLFEDGPREPVRNEPPSTEGAVRVCRKCSAQARSGGLSCPHCGASYLRGWKGMRRRAKVLLIAVPLLLLLGGGASGAVVKVQHDRDVSETRERAERLADEQREREAREQREAEQKEEAQAALDQVKRDVRRSIETEMRRAIRKDANERIADGYLEGPDVRRVSCNPVAGGSDSLEEPTARYECLAVNETDYVDGTDSGYRFTSTVNFDKGSYTWRLGD
jgi:hypothetical protein